MNRSCYVLLASSAISGDQPCYAFAGAAGRMRWPVCEGMGLGAVGAWNLLLRLGGNPRWLSPNSLPEQCEGSVLFAAIDGEPAAEVETALSQWLRRGGRIVGAGTWAGWIKLLELPHSTWMTSGYPYAALAFLDEKNPPDIAAPPGWRYLQLNEVPDGTGIRGKLAAVRGERQTPSRALISPLDGAPALIIRGGLTYFNANPFAAFQAWLQGQEDLGPWLCWRHRLFWLDEHAAWLGRVLADCGLTFSKTGIAGLPDTVIVLRHDLDYSRDTAYLDLEEAQGVPGVHAILDDANAEFWVRRLANARLHEAAFHYNTGTPARVRRGMARLLGRAEGGYLPSRHAIAGRGLLRQVRRARRLGIGVATLHRHLAYLIYPEWVDALDHLLKNEEEVLGSSSLFRATVLRWGAQRVDGAAGTLGEFPDAQFPYWFPFRLAHAGRGGLPLRGWESASVMEIEPELFEQMLDHRVADLPQRVITLNFHPAHAGKPTFAPAGGRPWFERILGIIKERDLAVMTLREVYLRMERAANNGRHAGNG